MVCPLKIPALLALLGAIGACASPSSVPSSETPQTHALFEDRVIPYAEQDAATREANARLKGYFPNHTLTTQDGEEVRFFDDLVLDKQVLINFMYVDCDGL